MELINKMLLNINALMHELTLHEAQSKIKAREEKYQRQNALRAFNSKQKQINNKKIQFQRTRHK